MLIRRSYTLALSFFFGGCSLLFGRLSAQGQCDASFIPSCDGDTLTTCESGIVLLIKCPSGACIDGQPTCQSNCGDNVQSEGEECEPPGSQGCNVVCQRISLCGDKKIDFPESCDDGSQCTDGSDCTEDASRCQGIGDGSCAPRDDNKNDGTGCAQNCRLEGIPEPEPNDTPEDAATQTALTQSTLIRGSFSSSSQGDLTDIFKVQIPQETDVFLHIETLGAEGQGSCGLQTRLALFNSVGQFVFPELEEEFGVGGCSHIDIPPLLLGAGELFVQVALEESFTGEGDYFLEIGFDVCGDGVIGLGEECEPSLEPGCAGCVHSSTCGDGLLSPNEGCDDGNAQSGDGCSATCNNEEAIAEIEPNDNATLQLIEESALIEASISPFGEKDLFEVHNKSNKPQALRASMLGPALDPINCDFTGTLAFFTGGTLLAIETREPEGLCPSLDLTLAPDQRVGVLIQETPDPLPDGQFVVDLINKYFLSMQLSECGDGVVGLAEECDPPGTASCDTGCQRFPVCGDGLVDSSDETGIHETCDDQNTQEDDGCDNSCHIDAFGRINEIEPNDDGAPSFSIDIGSGGNDFSAQNANRIFINDTEIVAALFPAGDEDVFAIQNVDTAPAVVHLEVYPLAKGLGGPCLTDEDFVGEPLHLTDDPVIVLRDQFGTQRQKDDVNISIDQCPSLDFVLAPSETLFAHISHFFDNKVMDDYVLRIDFVGCGDGALNNLEECEPPGSPGCDLSCQRIPVCGDGFVDAPENCDGGGGCSSSCLFEAADVGETEPNDDGAPSVNGGATGNDFTLTSFNGPFFNDAVIGATILPSGDEDTFAITNNTGASVEVRVDTFSPTLGLDVACNIFPVLTDTVLNLRDSNGQLLAQNDDRVAFPAVPQDLCSGLSFTLTPSETVFAHVLARADIPTIDGYLLRVSFVLCGDNTLDPGEECDPPGTASCDSFCQRIPACGDGFIDDPEECDDGDNFDGDGCDPFCQLTSPIFESEPNEDGSPSEGIAPGPLGPPQQGNDFSTANAEGPFSDFTTIFAALLPKGDEDVFAVHNPGAAPINLVVEILEKNGNPFCSPDELSIILRDASGLELARSSPDSELGSCPSLRGVTLAPNEIAYAHVVHISDRQSLTYVLRIDTSLCGDGNIELEEECELPGSPSCDATCQRVPVCGDGLIDDPEGCDDSNLIDGDGCSSLCQLESIQESEPNEDGSPSLAGPPGPIDPSLGNDFSAQNAQGPIEEDTTLLAQIFPAGDEDVFEIFKLGLGGPGSFVTVQINTFSPLSGIGQPCPPGIDTVLHVRNSSGTLIATNDDRNASIGDRCSSLEATLAPGQFLYIHVVAFGDQSEIPGYLLEIDFQ